MLQFIFVFVCTSAHVDAMRTEICEMPSNQNDVEKLKYLNAVCGVCVCRQLHLHLRLRFRCIFHEDQDKKNGIDVQHLS